MKGLAKRFKRVGLRNFTHWRVRMLTYAGKPESTKPGTIVP